MREFLQVNDFGELLFALCAIALVVGIAGIIGFGLGGRK